jgi:parvulin-like peptidyl-prolyl isomerase
MKRLVIAVGLLALLLAACSGSSSVAATVDGTDITRADVEGLVRDTGEEITETDFLTFLSVAIQWEAVEKYAAAEFGLEPDDDEVQRRVDDLVAAFSPTATLEEYLEQVNASPSGIEKYARQLIIQESITTEIEGDYPAPTEADVAAELAAFPMDWTEVCSAHILVETKEEADTVYQRLQDGEDFATLAEEVSTDVGSGANGGDLGCTSPSQFVEPFAEGAMAAEIGVPTEPIESQFGFHIILVESRTAAEFEEVSAYLDAQARSDAIDAWFITAIESAEVTVDPEIGEWSTDPFPQVLPAT